MAQYPADDVRARARAWIDSVNGSSGMAGGWRLEILRLRSRRKFDASAAPSHSPVVQELSQPPPYPVPSDVPVSTSSGSSGEIVDVNGDPVSSGPVETQGPCPDAPLRIRRFVQGCPWALVPEAIRYLHELAPYEGIVFNGVKLPGRYRPTVTSWNRDEGERVAEGRDVTGTYTLVQDLVEISDCADDLLSSTAVSCMQDEETRFVWDADSVDMSELEELTCDASQGVTVSIRAVSRDEAGLFSYQVVKTRAKSVAAGPYLVSCSKSEYVEETVWRNLYGCPSTGLRMDPAEGCGNCRAPSLAGVPAESCTETERGVRTQWEVRQNQDCTWDVTRRVRRPRDDGRKSSWREGVSCQETHVDSYANWTGTDLAAEVDAKYAALSPGEALQASIREDEDGTWSGTVSVRKPPAELDWTWTRAEGPCSATFSRAVRNDPDYAPSLAPAALDELEAAARAERPDLFAGDGGMAAAVRRSAQMQRNADCTWDADYSVEPAGRPARRTWAEGVGCAVTETVLYKDWPVQPELPSPTPSKRVSARLQMDDDCTWSGTVEATSVPADVEDSWTDGVGCRLTETTYYHRATARPEVPAPGPNTSVSARLQMADDCTWSGTVETTALPSRVEGWDEGTECRPAHVTWYHRAAEMPEVPAASGGTTVQANLRMADDCTWSGEVRVTEPQAPESRRTVSSGGSTQVEREYWWSQVGDPPESIEAGPGETVDISLQRNADCTWDWVKTTRKSVPCEATARYVSCDGSVVESTTYTGQPDDDFAKVQSSGPGESVRSSARCDGDGTYSGEVVRSTSGAVEPLEIVEGTVNAPVRTTRLFGVTREQLVLAPDRVAGYSVSVTITPHRDDCTYDEAIAYQPLRGGGASGWEIWGPNMSSPVVVAVEPVMHDPTDRVVTYVVTCRQTGFVSNTATAIAGQTASWASSGWAVSYSSFGSNGTTGEGRQVMVMQVTATKCVTVTVEGDTEEDRDRLARVEGLQKAGADKA